MILYLNYLPRRFESCLRLREMVLEMPFLFFHAKLLIGVIFFRLHSALPNVPEQDLSVSVFP